MVCGILAGLPQHVVASAAVADVVAGVEQPGPAACSVLDWLEQHRGGVHVDSVDGVLASLRGVTTAC